jgi:hypothetical protein
MIDSTAVSLDSVTELILQAVAAFPAPIPAQRDAAVGG